MPVCIPACLHVCRSVYLSVHCHNLCRLDRHSYCIFINEIKTALMFKVYHNDHISEVFKQLNTPLVIEIKTCLPFYWDKKYCKWISLIEFFSPFRVKTLYSCIYTKQWIHINLRKNEGVAKYYLLIYRQCTSVFSFSTFWFLFAFLKTKNTKTVTLHSVNHCLSWNSHKISGLQLWEVLNNF
jgi:hypothetical protein